MLTLDRPPANAIDPVTLEYVAVVLERAGGDVSWSLTRDEPHTKQTRDCILDTVNPMC